jgi:flagellar hook-associated protein 3 FlgL
MRVTQTTLSNQALAALQDAMGRLAKTQNQLATQRRISTPSDDPAGHGAAVRLEARRAAVIQFRRQADQAQTALTSTDSLLQSLQSLSAQAQELAVRGADDTNGVSERAAMAAEVNQLLEEMVAQANTDNDGRHLLGGQETLTAPLSVTRDGSGKITAAAWNPRGVDGVVSVDVGPGRSVQTNVGGTAALGGDSDPTFAPAVLIALRDALTANDPDGVRATLAQFQAADTRLGNAITDTGGRLRRVEQAQQDLDADRLTAESALSAVIDADLARVSTDLAQQQLAYQAALHAMASAIQPTLLDFLR